MPSSPLPIHGLIAKRVVKEEEAPPFFSFPLHGSLVPATMSVRCRMLRGGEAEGESGGGGRPPISQSHLRKGGGADTAREGRGD